MMKELTIDPEFEAKCPLLTEEELELLEENIISEGTVLMPIIIWNGTIIDGHNRWKILKRHPNVEYRIYEKQFENRYEAISWICKNQLGRRNLTPQQRKYLIGQRYEAEKKAHGAKDGFRGNQYSEPVCTQKEHIPENKRTCERIAKETHTSHAYVQRAAPYAKGIDAAEKAVPGIKNALLIGELKANDKEVTAIGIAPPEDRISMVEAIQKANEDRANGKASNSKRNKQRISNIYQDMKTTGSSVDDEEIIHIIERIGENMVSTCESVFESYPDFLKSPENGLRAAAALQSAKKYIVNMEGTK